MRTNTLRYVVEEPVGRALLAVLIGLGLGAACLLLSPRLVLLALGGLAGAYVVFKRPELLLLAIFIFSSSFVPEEEMIIVDVGMRLYITDLFVIFGFAMVALRWVVEPKFTLIRSPINLPLLAFFIIAMATTQYGLRTGTTDIDWALSEIRIIGYYLVFFFVTNLVRSEGQVRLLLDSFFMLTLIVSIGMIVQFALGSDVPILPGRVETLVTTGTAFSDVTRIVSPGESLMLTSFITMTAMLAVGGFSFANPLRVIQWGAATIGVILTFNRNFWVAAGIALILLAVLITNTDRARLLRIGGAIIGVLAVVLTFALATPETRASDLVLASFDRLFSLTREENYATEDSTFLWRQFEYTYGIPQIVERPITGLGLGAIYRPYNEVIDFAYGDGLQRYTHNAHMWLLIKAGIFGYAAFALTLLIFVVRGLHFWSRLRQPLLRGVVLGFALTVIGASVSAIVNPIFMQWYWTPVLGTMIGINEAIIRHYAEGEAAA
jgi:O-antigen ligase